MHSIVAVIPLYNGASYIEQSLRSVLAQTRPADEILVVDDGSSDAGAQLALDIAGDVPGFRLLRKRNGGQSSARNFGVRNARSDLIAFLDQDDAWYPTHLERLAAPFDTNPPHRLGWVYSNLDEIDIDGLMIKHRFLPGKHPKADVRHCLSEDMFVLPSASLIARLAFDAVGGFDEQFIGYEDDDLFLRLFRAGYANIFLDEALSMWRIHSASTSFTGRMGQSRLRYARKLIAAFPDRPERARFWARDLIAPRFSRNFLGDIHASVRHGRPEQHRFASDALRELVPYLPLNRRLLATAALPVLTSYPLMRLLDRMRVLAAMRALRRRR